MVVNTVNGSASATHCLTLSPSLRRILKLWPMLTVLLAIGTAFALDIRFAPDVRRGPHYYRHAVSMGSAGRSRTNHFLAQEMLEEDDIRRHPFVGDWHYYYRQRGMQTSTDDVLVAFVACIANFPDFCEPFPAANSPEHELASSESQPLANRNAESVQTEFYPQPCRYVDLGCGIGSILLLVAHSLSPMSSIGLEVQSQSYRLASKTIQEIQMAQTESSLSRIGGASQELAVLNMDLRGLLHEEVLSVHEPLKLFWERSELVTANPPYSPAASSHTLAKSSKFSYNLDSQRRNARFELHGGVEEYCRAAAQLLLPRNGYQDGSRGGRFVLSFWASGASRVEDALKAAGLQVQRRMHVLAGRPDATLPYLTIFEAINYDKDDPGAVATDWLLDIRRDAATNRLSWKYQYIQKLLNMQKRPLK